MCGADGYLVTMDVQAADPEVRPWFTDRRC
jgi:hypothetical protein